MRASATRGAWLGFGFFVNGCTAVPSLHEDGVAISEIVQRIKCELAFAVPDVRGQYPTGPYQWMKYWTAKVDLTLNTNEQSSVSPSVSFSNPMTQVVLPGIGTFSRLFNVAAGAGISGTAIRNETLSFTLSMDELMHSKHLDCDFSERQGLLGHLGLTEWVASALAPVGNKQLTLGYHAAPVGKPVQIPGPTEAFQKTTVQNPDVAKAQLAIRAAEVLAEGARQYADKAKTYALNKQIQLTYDAVAEVYGRAETAADQIDKAQEFAWQAKIKDRDGITVLSKEEKDALGRVSDDAKATGDQAAKARQIAKAAWELLPRDPPIDSIAHQAQFIVAANANVTPSWTLVKFKGPGATGTFASASYTSTNNLNLVLGEPADAGGKALSDEQRRQLLNQKLDSLRLFVVPIQSP